MRTGGQLRLFGHDEPAFDATFARAARTSLGGGAWIEHVPGWLSGDTTLFEVLRANVAWRAESRTMYEREVDVPRLYASIEGRAPHPILESMRAALDARYGESFVRTSAAWYRDGKDSVAWHGDYVARELDVDTHVATVSLGAPRTFLVRARGGGASRAWSLGTGDLLVMGGRAQRTHEHCVPKAADAGARIAVMYRPAWG
jgi:alkylated DNA repair dioxygenase AlkB